MWSFLKEMPQIIFMFFHLVIIALFTTSMEEGTSRGSFRIYSVIGAKQNYIFRVSSNFITIHMEFN